MKKRYREGNLSGERWDSPPDLHGKNENSIYGLDDFLSKAEQLAKQMDESGPIRSERSKSLRNTIDVLNYELARGADRRVIHMAVCAGLTYANLALEKKLDPKENENSKATRSEYFEALKKAESRERLAELLDMSVQGLRKWEKRNLK